MWSNGRRQNSETDEEHDEDSVEEWFQLAMIKYDRNGEGGREKYDSDVERARETLGVGNCSINIRDGSELELALWKKSSLYFEKIYYLVFRIYRFVRCVMFYIG